MNTKSLSHRVPLRAAALTLVCQIAGFCGGVLLQQFFLATSASLALHVLIAGGLSRFLSLPGVWQMGNVLFPALAFIALTVAVPGWLLALLCVLILLTYLPTFWTRVPFYPSSNDATASLIALLPESKEFTFLDLGSGFGTFLLGVARKLPRARFTGVELGPLPCFLARLRSLAHSNVTITLKSFWEMPLGDYDYVYAFLSPTPMEALWEKARSEMGPGSVFITNTFVVPAIPDEVVDLEDDRQQALYVFRMENHSKQVK